MTAPHVPCVDPWGTTQTKPLQQSALMVHPPDSGLHATPPSGGAGRQVSCPCPFGTQGAPLQQSPVYEHACPALTHDGIA